MSALITYANMVVAVNGGTLLEAQSVDVSRDTKAQQVDTMAKGFGGMSPGAAQCTISVKNAVPMAGIEFNADKFWTNTGVPLPVEISLFVGSANVLTARGFILKDTLTGATNSPSGYSFEFTGQYAAVG